MILHLCIVMKEKGNFNLIYCLSMYNMQLMDHNLLDLPVEKEQLNIKKLKTLLYLKYKYIFTLNPI